MTSPCGGSDPDTGTEDPGTNAPIADAPIADDSANGRPRVLLTRARVDGGIGAALADAGFVPVAAALTRTLPADDATRARLLDLLPGAAWAVLTSPTAVRVLAGTAAEHGLDLPGLLAATPVAAVGSATAAALAEAGCAPALLAPPHRSDADGLAEAFPHGPAEASNRRVVLPCSALARPVLADSLRAKGWEVERVETYTTQTADLTAGERAALTQPWPAAVVVTSGSNARAMADLLGTPPPGTAVVALGRPTATALAALGIAPAAVAAQPTPDGIVAAVRAALHGG